MATSQSGYHSLVLAANDNYLPVDEDGIGDCVRLDGHERQDVVERSRSSRDGDDPRRIARRLDANLGLQPNRACSCFFERSWLGSSRRRTWRDIEGLHSLPTDDDLRG